MYPQIQGYGITISGEAAMLVAFSISLAVILYAVL